MKADIHPKYNQDSVTTCVCGATFQIGSTMHNVSVEICSQCHPFYTGEQRIVDTAGQVERFMKRIERRMSDAARRELETKARKEADDAARKARARGDDPEAAAKAVLTQYGVGDD